MELRRIFLTLGLVLTPFLAVHIAKAERLPSAATDIFFQTIDAKDGLADNTVRDITRDSYGYIWVSTINGLSRYDGYRMTNYMPMQAGGRANDVMAVSETADTTLWMVSVRELFTYDRVKDVWQKDGAERLDKLGVEGKMSLFYVDDRHNLWVVTEMGLYHYDYSQRRLQHFSNYSRSAIGHIVSKNGTTLVVTTDYKIYEVALKENRLNLIAQAPFGTYDRDSKVFLDTKMNLWILNAHATAGYQWLLALKDRQWRQLSELQEMGNALVNVISEDNDGHIWIGSGNTDIRVYGYQDEFPEKGAPAGTRLKELMRLKAFLPPTSHVACFYLDSNNTMWVGSAKLGVAFTDMNSPRFNHIATTGYEDVSSMLQDAKGNLWVGFDGSGVIMKTPAGAVTHYSAAKKMLPSDIVTSLATDRDGHILVGTYGQGITRISGSSFQQLYPDDSNLRYIKAMTTDAHGSLWVATVDNGVVRIMPDGNRFNYTSENSPLLSNGILCLAYDAVNDMVYIGTSVGVSAFDCTKRSFSQIKEMDELKGSYISTLLICRHNYVWIGSRNGLWIYSPKEGTIRHLTTEQGLSHNVIRALAKTAPSKATPEREGRACVWASTDNGLTRITSDLQCHPFLDSDGLHNIVFSTNAALTTSDGAALLGSFTGYVRIESENIVSRLPRLHVEFTEYRINGVTNDQFPISHTMQYGDRLGISVSAMVPSQTSKIKYQYRFKGEKNWMRVPGNMLYFVGLQPGRHVLQVKAEIPGMTQNANDGTSGTNGISELTIEVKAPFWLSTPAILFYLLLLGALAYLLYVTIRRRQKRELAIKQLEMNLEKYEMEEEKIRFFTNISHDLKTPLTLVIAPLEKIRQNNLPHSIRTELDVAWRNARQLYDLILQLLDFRKLDVGMEKVNLRHGDIVAFVRQAIQGFAYYATPKQIRLQMQLPPAPVMINFDENKIRRIITNLLSNAYKYNADNGQVTVSLDIPQTDGSQKLVIKVADTGIGIADKQHIFERFVQETHGQEQEGSGIGLHIVKQYVDMMGGHINVTDNEPKGTVFTVTLPIDDTADGNVEELTSDNEPLADGLITDNGVQDKATILVIDDNTDARLFLQRSLDDEYHVLVAANGKEALQVLARKDNISIIVSDVMMPEMDGIEFFREIKSNISYSHIPVILLTAKSSEENIVAGLEEGVADYITKPFSLAVLRLRIRKVLEWSQNVYNIVATGIEIKPGEITVSSLDEELISHVIANIEANIQNVDYSVAQLSSDVGMTRGHLYKKLMAITGKSPLEFMRIIKLKRGKSLLDQGRTNISEVADMVGLSAKQFAHYFKLMYDDTPSEYLKKKKE